MIHGLFPVDKVQAAPRRSKQQGQTRHTAVDTKKRQKQNRLLKLSAEMRRLAKSGASLKKSIGEFRHLSNFASASNLKNFGEFHGRPQKPPQNPNRINLKRLASRHRLNDTLRTFEQLGHRADGQPW
jgi:hypothetical protein